MTKQVVIAVVALLALLAVCFFSNNKVNSITGSPEAIKAQQEATAK